MNLNGLLVHAAKISIHITVSVSSVSVLHKNISHNILSFPIHSLHLGPQWTMKAAYKISLFDEYNYQYHIEQYQSA